MVEEGAERFLCDSLLDIGGILYPGIHWTCGCLNKNIFVNMETWMCVGGEIHNALVLDEELQSMQLRE